MILSMSTWKALLALRSDAVTLFWVFEYAEICGTMSSSRSGETTVSFICTRTAEMSVLLRSAWWMVAVV
jgi:hypothetical protein